jgi:NADH:ubiquinone reductase (H+-translocating)
VVVAGERIEARTILWAVGVAASPAAKWLQAKADRAGRVVVRPDLTLPAHSEIFVIGDTAAAVDVTGKPLPGVASVAKQQGIYVARVVRARLKGISSAPLFHYRDYGNLATVGRKIAVADLGFLRLSGRRAWWLWGAVHIFLSTRLSQSDRHYAERAVGILYVPARREVDHRTDAVAESDRA